MGMDELFFFPKPGDPAEAPPMEQVDPLLSRRVETRPWELRAAQWKARFLAEMAFEGEVGVSLVGRPGYPSFRGLLHLSVPFRDLTDHEKRQALLMRWVGDDPVLRRVPLVFIFEPRPVHVP
jgi:hypothetical protein